MKTEIFRYKQFCLVYFLNFQKHLFPTLASRKVVFFFLCNNSHNNRKHSLETWAVLLILSLELKISGVAIQRIHQKREAVLLILSLELKISEVTIQGIHQKSKKLCLLWELPTKNDFVAVLATFCCYDHDAKVFEAVQKIATNQKEYHICSSCVIIWWITKI